jgi:SPP1 family predicted phage head-tail adaptor
MSKNINAGKYRHRITIKQSPTDTTRDTFGRRKGSWTTVARDVWAQKEDWQGQETTEAGRDTASVTTKFKIRYRTDVSAAMRIYHGAVIYLVDSVLDFDGTHHELVLNCRRVVE